MTASTSGTALITALCEAVKAAPEAKRNALAQAIEDYATQRGRAYHNLFERGGLAGMLMTELVETVDARPVPSSR